MGGEIFRGYQFGTSFCLICKGWVYHARVVFYACDLALDRSYLQGVFNEKAECIAYGLDFFCVRYSVCC